MGGVDRLANVGGHIAVVKGIKSTNASAGTITGAVIDRASYGYAESCVIYAANGDAAGSPTAQSLNVKLQECATSGGTYTDVSGAAITAIAADDTAAYKDFDLTGVERYVKLVAVVAFTAGTTPSIPVNASLILGGAYHEPIS
jgi:hypothetical protein